ncbi:LexA family transcriptional regulator [Phenylobacterium sp.]|uniref:LexA family transcriptional regulator n=1 Tax=Phenylobacterium sp. TaxID=1871053 RepID=UPI002E365A4A|nr:S24 family peptidase [Phenylobacterium sp.]HEX2558955.1 S24 family peptidase [Phenylobacterium sp.]
MRALIVDTLDDASPCSRPGAIRLRQARVAAGFETAAEAAGACGWDQQAYAVHEAGVAPFDWRGAKVYASALGVRTEWLYAGAGQACEPGYAPVLGRAGADPSGAMLFATGQSPGELAPLPPGATAKAMALRVAGDSMRGLADDGALIFFEDQRTPPTHDMLGHVVVLETETDEVLVKRLLRGSRSGLFDLESLDAPPRNDVRLRWAAHITAIVPPYQARRILVSAG